MIDGLTRLLLEKYSPHDPRLTETLSLEPEKVQKGIEDMPPSLIALIAKELDKAAKRKKDSQ